MRAQIFFLAWLFLLALPVLLLTNQYEKHFSISLIPIFICISYSGYRLAYISAIGRQEIVATTFWVFIYVFLGICPFLQISTNTFPWPGYYEDAVLFKAGMIILTSIFSFEIGNRVLPKKFVTTIAPTILKKPIQLNTVGLLAIVAIILAIYFQHKLGGIANLFVTRIESTQYLQDQSTTGTIAPKIALMNKLARTPTYVILIATLVVWVTYIKNRKKISLKWKLLAIILFGFVLILNNPISTPRLMIGTILLSFFFILPWQRQYGLYIVFGLIVTLVLVFPFSDLFRNTLDVSLKERIEQKSVIDTLISKGDFDAYQLLVDSVVVIDNTSYQLGKQISSAFLFWVPRSIWINKGKPTGEFIAEQVGYKYTNLSAPLWMEFYVDGGWIFVVIGFIGYGIFVQALDYWNYVYQFSTKNLSPKIVLIFVPIYAGYQIFLLRGALLPAIAYLSSIVLFIYLCSIRVTLNIK